MDNNCNQPMRYEAEEPALGWADSATIYIPNYLLKLVKVVVVLLVHKIAVLHRFYICLRAGNLLIGFPSESLVFCPRSLISSE